MREGTAQNAEKLMPKTLYLQLYDSLPEEAKQAMSDLWETGKNDSGVWVRFGNVEATVGKIAQALMRQPVRCWECRYYEIAQLRKDGEDDRRYKPSVCLRGKYAKPRDPDWFCADGRRKEDAT